MGLEKQTTKTTTVKELIAELSTFDADTIVTVSDGFNCMFYRGSYTVSEFTLDDGTICCDIGVGGTLED